VKFLIVDGSSAIYGRLIERLGGVKHLAAIASARTLREAVSKARELLPDVAVLDTTLPDGNGLEALADIKFHSPHTRFPMFSNQIEQRGKATLAGTDGFFDKSLECEALVARLVGANAHTIQRGEA